jgi:phosphonopyruvate decarboxylase
VIAARGFLAAARARGFDFYTGVPCSFLTPFINGAIGDAAIDYVGAASEGEAVAIAAGAWLAGRRTVVMCQNSGLGNCVNPLTSLNFPFRIPTLLITTWRGQPGLEDEPQHELMGRITRDLLETLGIPWRSFPKAEEDVEAALRQADATMTETNLPFAMVMEKGSVADEDLVETAAAEIDDGVCERRGSGGPRPRRAAVLERFLAEIPDRAAVIATTGKCGRELFTLDDRDQHLYQVGSMGCASAMGLGVALNAKRPVVVLDGDGAALMKMGTLATIGACRPDNLVHVVLDNGTHDSTGGQPTVSASVDFASVAVACGYRRGVACDDVDTFAAAFAETRQAPGPHLIHARIAPGSMADLGRPTVKPPDVARRFKAFLAGD